MSGFYPLVRQLHVALRLPNMPLILLSISLGRYRQVYINPLYKDVF